MKLTKKYDLKKIYLGHSDIAIPDEKDPFWKMGVFNQIQNWCLAFLDKKLQNIGLKI